MTKWLRAYAVAAHGKEGEAKGMIASEDPPPPSAPLAFRAIAAMAYASVKDVKHGADHARSVLATGYASPDAAYIADRLNLPKVAEKRRK
jgi:hypothetical protein